MTYKNYVNLVTQHLTSIYTDAEILIVDKKDYVDIKPQWYSLRAASLGKEHDYVYPIKTYKYLEDDPLNNFSNVFGGLHKDGKAVFQLVIKHSCFILNIRFWHRVSLHSSIIIKKNN